MVVALGAATFQLIVLWCVATWVLGGRGTPLGLRLAALAWGACVVPFVASFANTRNFAILAEAGLHSFAAAIAAPIDENTLCIAGTLGVLSVAARRLPVTVLDGLRTGFLVGAGFEVAENLDYLTSAPMVDWPLLAARLGIGFALHALWTGIAGAGIGMAMGAALDAGTHSKLAHLAARRALIAVLILCPVLLHAAWDAPSLSVRPAQAFIVPIAVWTISLLACIALAWRAGRVTPRPQGSGS